MKRDLITPAEAGAVFGDRLPLAEQYVALLAGAGIERGLVGPREKPRLWDRHMLNCGVVAELILPGELVADIGSGAGLPGVPLAIARPDLRVVLIEPMLRRVDFLEQVKEELGLQSVTVVRARAEDHVADDPFDVVTARAVAKIGQLARWSLPLLRTGGRLLALKGVSVYEELDSARQSLKKAGASSWTVERAGRETLSRATVVAIVTK